MVSRAPLALLAVGCDVDVDAAVLVEASKVAAGAFSIGSADRTKVVLSPLEASS